MRSVWLLKTSPKVVVILQRNQAHRIRNSSSFRPSLKDCLNLVSDYKENESFFCLKSFIYHPTTDCPCENFDCDSLEADKKILVLYSDSSFSKKPALLSQNGELKFLENFVFERETIVSHSCSVVLNGEMLVFGADLVQYYKQISSVGSCNLARR